MSAHDFESAAATNAGGHASASATNRDADIIANVLDQIEPVTPEVSNIFADEQDDGLRPMTTPIPVNSTGRSADGISGMDATIDLSLWNADPSRKPRIIRGFDTDQDRVLLLGAASDALPDLQVKRTKQGIPVLCHGNARLLVLPGMTGQSGIDALVLDIS